MFCCTSRDDKNGGDNSSFFGLFHSVHSVKSFSIGKDDKTYTVEKKPFIGLPDEDSVLVEVHFATLTIKDRDDILHPTQAINPPPAVEAVEGQVSPIQPKETKTLFGHDFSGVIAKAGEKSGYSKGDKVYGWVEQAAFSDFIITNAANIAKVPKDIELEVAASLPYAGWVAYKTFADLKKDETVHINGNGFLVDFLKAIALKTTSHVTGNTIMK